MSAPSRRCGEALPIDSLLPEILLRLPPGGTLLLQAPPGAGKTTRVPLALLQHLGPHAAGSPSILMLEPRRLAAKAAALRLAESLGEEVGTQVGYRVRLEHCCTPATRLEVLTDGMFLRRLQDDPALTGVACVIFDEFHERRSEADLALALVREARPLLNPPLRLLVMSATLNLQPLGRQLPEAEVLTSEGQGHPVERHHQPPRERESLGQQVVRALEQHWLCGPGDPGTALVFLPGQKEIRQAQRAIEATTWGLQPELHALHGGLSLAAQGRAIAASRGPAGKVVLATAIAESSLTIAGVRLVVDSGLSRRSRFDPRTGMDGLVTVPASQASATQRQGRAGRLGPAACGSGQKPSSANDRPLTHPNCWRRIPCPWCFSSAAGARDSASRCPGWIHHPCQPCVRALTCSSSSVGRTARGSSPPMDGPWRSWACIRAWPTCCWRANGWAGRRWRVTWPRC
jgi:ATP-dependent helicase HrpB